MAAAAAPQVLRELGNSWLECMDEQGVYYFNSATQQSSDFMPADANDAQAQMPMVEANPEAQYGDQVFQQLPHTQQIGEPNQPAVQYAQPAVQYAQPAAQPQYAQPAAQPTQPSVQSAQPARKKMIIGEWWVMEDAQGVFFVHSQTKQESNEVPPELANIYPQVAHLSSHVVQPSAFPPHAAPVQQSQMHMQVHHGQVAAPAMIQHQPQIQYQPQIQHQPMHLVSAPMQYQQQYQHSFMPPQQQAAHPCVFQQQQPQMPVQMFSMASR